MANDPDSTLYDGLTAIAADTFPKKCRNCGHVYDDAAAYVADTLRVSERSSGLKASVDDDGHAIVELFRNCRCGSTLMDAFSERRDTSAAGERRRRRFGELVDYLVKQGLAASLARHELLTVLHGGKSEVLRRLSPPARR